MQTDPEDRAFTRPWEREVSFDLGRAYSGSDLPNFGGLIAPVGTTPDRATPPLVPASPAFLEDYSPKVQPFLAQTDEFASHFGGGLQHLKISMVPSPLPCGAFSLNGEETLLEDSDTPHLTTAETVMPSSRFSSLSSAECTNIRANLPMLMENRGVHSGCLFAAELKPSGEPLGDEEGGEDGEEANEQSKDLDSKEEVARAECSDSDYRPSPRQRPRSRRAAARGRPARRTSYSKGNNKKKVGRPITYKGDPEASNLTEEEKRRIKRRIANRESARRVRQKRHDLMEDLQVNIETMQQRNGKLLAHCGRIEKQKAAVMGQMAEMQEKWGQAASEGSRLQAEIATMRQTLEVNMRFMENAGARIQGPGSLQQHNGPMPHYAGDLPAQDVLQGNAVMLPTNMSSPFKTAFQDFVSSVPLWT